MFILDTDHLSLLEWMERTETGLLRSRLSMLPSEEKAATIISFEEQMRGWMAYLAKCRTMAEQVEGYRRLKQQINNYCKIAILEFNEPAAA